MSSRGPSARRGVARSLHHVASRGLSARRSVAQSLHAIASSGPSAPHGIARSVHHVASRGPSAPRDIAWSLCTTWRRAVSLHAVASHGPSARRSVARSLCTTWRRAVPLHTVVSCGLRFSVQIRVLRLRLGRCSPKSQKFLRDTFLRNLGSKISKIQKLFQRVTKTFHNEVFDILWVLCPSIAVPNLVRIR